MCDPDPTVSGNAVLLFDAFSGSALDAGWIDDGGAFTVQGDAAVHADDTRIDLLRRTDIDTADTVIAAHIRFESVGGALANVGVMTHMTGPVDGIDCESNHEPSHALALIELANNQLSSTLDSSPLPVDPVGHSFLIVAGGGGGQLGCAWVEDSGTEVDAAGVGGAAGGGFAVRARNSAVEIDSVIVISLVR